MKDLGVNKFQRLLLHERIITEELWKLFKKFLKEYSANFDEFGVSTSWITLKHTIDNISVKNFLIQTTPDIIIDQKIQKI